MYIDKVDILVYFVIIAEGSLLAMMGPTFYFLYKMRKNPFFSQLLAAGMGDDAALTKTRAFFANLIMDLMRTGANAGNIAINQNVQTNGKGASVEIKYKFPAPPDIPDPKN